MLPSNKNNEELTHAYEMGLNVTWCDMSTSDAETLKHTKSVAEILPQFFFLCIGYGVESDTTIEQGKANEQVHNMQWSI